jgi:hypothetical protein
MLSGIGPVAAHGWTGTVSAGLGFLLLAAVVLAGHALRTRGGSGDPAVTARTVPENAVASDGSE